MQFVNPWFLAGLAAISIPILIHLFNFHRYKKVYFTNVRFLQALQTETRRTSRLRSWILLLLRIFFILCLVMAFAQPYFPSGMQIDRRMANRVSIYLDNSLSMDVQGTGGNVFRTAGSRAAEILSGYSRSDRFHIITNDLEGKHHQLVSQEQAGSWLQEVNISPSSPQAAGILQTQAEVLKQDGNGNRIAYVISDFSRKTFNLPPNPDPGVHWFFVPVGNPSSRNLSIDSCWFESPVIHKGLETELKFRITHHGKEEAVDATVQLHTGNLQRGLVTVSLQPGQSMVSGIRFILYESGHVDGFLRIDDNGFGFDNHLYFSLRVSPLIEVLSINADQPNPFLTRLFSVDTGFRIYNQPVQSLNYSQPARTPLIILNEINDFPDGLVQSLTQAFDGGRSVLVIPSVSADQKRLEIFLNRFGMGARLLYDTIPLKAGEVNTNSFLFRDALEKLPENPLLPGVLKYLRILTGTRSEAEVFIKLQNDEPFLIGKPFLKGHLFLLATPLREDHTDFMRNTLFVPGMINMALAGERRNALYAIYGKLTAFSFSSDLLEDMAAPRLVHKESRTEVIPFFKFSGSQAEVIVRSETPVQGLWNLKWGNNLAGSIAVNFDRKESYTDFYTPEELSDLLKDSGWEHARVIDGNGSIPLLSSIHEYGNRTRLWKVFLIAALLFMAAEVILLRFWK